MESLLRVGEREDRQKGHTNTERNCNVAMRKKPMGQIKRSSIQMNFCKYLTNKQ